MSAEQTFATVDDFVAWNESGAAWVLFVVDADGTPWVMWESESGDWFGTRALLESLDSREGALAGPPLVQSPHEGAAPFPWRTFNPDPACRHGSVVDEADGRVRCASCHDVVRSRSVYVASSWRNPFQPGVVAVLRAAGLDVYDFRNPPGGAGFGWEEVMPGYTPGSESVLPADYLEALQHPRAVEGYAADFAAMQAADTFVLVLPCGRSAHLELGWAVGAGKRTAILCELPDKPMVPELMYKLADHIAPTLMDLLKWLGIPN